MALPIAAVAPGVTAVRSPTAAPVRGVVDLRQGWRFHAGDAPGDEAWETVDLPHTWHARDGQDGGDDYRRGTGWYRRRLTVDPAWAGRRLFLELEGANTVAEVRVNGVMRLGGGLVAVSLGGDLATVEEAVEIGEEMARAISRGKVKSIIFASPSRPVAAIAGNPRLLDG